MRELLEKKIIGNINSVSKGKMTAREAKINDLISRLKELDEASAIELQGRYIKVLRELKY